MLPPCLTFYQQRVNHSLDTLLDTPNPFPRLQDAMRYVALDGGKRFRAALVYSSVEALGGEVHHADAAACAVELAHAYSLVHDDLPAMDNDDWRRGKPSCHKQFDESTAILVGDALQALAFEVLADQTQISEIQRIQQIKVLAKAIGSHGMVAGQAIDIHAMGGALSQTELEAMHSLKTGALIRSCVALGAFCVPAAPAVNLLDLLSYAELIGLAFQVHDDVLDVTGSDEVLGKKAGADALLNKPTFTSLLGVEKAREYAQNLVYKAIQKLTIFGESADNLRDLAAFCVEREV